MLDTGEPFGLPRGTVRGLIALAFTSLVIASYWATKSLDPVLAAFTLPYIGFYFATRQSEAPAVSQKVDPPFIPGGDVSQ